MADPQIGDSKALVKKAFHDSDQTGNGRLGFAEFYAFLRNLKPAFTEASA
jgi:hypothetical protein